MRYVDGFVLPVPKKSLPSYREMARQAARVWRKYGALENVEAAGDDLHPKWAAIRFPQTVKAKPA